MIAYYTGLNGMDKFFFLSAMAGGALFIFRLVLLLIGGGDGEIDAEGGADVGAEDSDSSFRVLSIQSLSAFFMMFGLVGLALSRQSGAKQIWALAGGVGAGLGAVWIIGRIFVGMKKLQSDGTLHFENAVGQTGRVYLGIKTGQIGKVEIAIQGRLKVVDACSEGPEDLPTDTSVKVIRVQSGNILVVRKADTGKS
ncbi:MAG: hypothetical protein U1E27_02620 [Kiritimatiellia bacterium]|nr:hypothetical protein [Kiritimatiellia bacterium]